MVLLLHVPNVHVAAIVARDDTGISDSLASVAARPTVLFLPSHQLRHRVRSAARVIPCEGVVAGAPSVRLYITAFTR